MKKFLCLLLILSMLLSSAGGRLRRPEGRQ